jgi:flagellar FliJ protein
MAGNKFELEQVLVYRREMEKLRKQEFAAAQEMCTLAISELKREKQLVEILTQEFKRCQSQIDCVDDIRMYADFFSRKREEIKLQKHRIEQLDLEMNEKRADLMEASKEKKVLEALKEKKTLEFKHEISVKERNFLDEISIQKKVRPA